MFEFTLFCIILFWFFMGFLTNYLYVNKVTKVDKRNIHVRDLKMLSVVMLLGPIAFWWRHCNYVLFKAKE